MGFYPDRLVARIRGRISRMRVYEPYGIVYWTKHPKNLLDHPALAPFARAMDNPVVNLTITGLGGTRFEPHVPRPEEVLALLPALVERVLRGQPARLRWRFDPIWPRPGLLEDFERLADELARVGATTCTFSFPARYSLRGPLTGIYRREGIPLPTMAQRAELLERLVALARPRGIRLLSCSQPENLTLLPPGSIEPAQCIPREILEGLHPEGRRFPLTGHDRSQRKACRCLPSEDVGSYRDDPCGSGCVYCYSKAGGTPGLERYQEAKLARPLDLEVPLVEKNR